MAAWSQTVPMLEGMVDKFPTVLLFKRNAKATPKVYDGELSYSAMVHWIDQYRPGGIKHDEL